MTENKVSNVEMSKVTIFEDKMFKDDVSPRRFVRGQYLYICQVKKSNFRNVRDTFMECLNMQKNDKSLTQLSLHLEVLCSGLE